MSRLLPKIAQEHKLQGHTEVQGIPIAIENRKGSVREGTTEDGHHWRTKMKFPYGYIEGTKGADDEPVDAYVGPDKDAPYAYVVHQHKPDGTGFDEDKVMLGFDSKEDARKAYLEHYDSDKFLGPISQVTMERLQELVDSGKKLEKISHPHVRMEKPGRCGAAALRIALRVHGMDMPEGTAAKLVNTDKEGADPESLASVAEAAGLDAEIVDGMKFHELAWHTAKGRPVVVAFQAWRGDTKRPAWEDNWDDGHYAVVLGVENDKVRISDSSDSDNSYLLDRAEFERRWHDVDKDGTVRDHLGIVISPKMEKRAYNRGVHFHLMNKTIQKAFGDDLTPEARRVMLDQARESDVGLRHPWNPWNAIQHAFPTLSKEELREETQGKHEEAIGSLARAIGDRHLSDVRRSVMATGALKDLAQAQHARIDVHSHHDKPLEIAEAKGGPERVQEFVKLRSALRDRLGPYGGFVSSGIEHLRSGFDLRLKMPVLRSELDKFNPEKWESDKSTLRTADEYGREIKHDLLRTLKSEHDLKPREAKNAVHEFLRSFSPGVVDEAAAEVKDTAKFLASTAGRLWRGGEKTSAVEPKGIKFLYMDTGGGHRAQAQAMVEAAQQRGIPAEAIHWGEFAKGTSLKSYEKAYTDYLQDKKGLPALGLAHIRFHMMGTDKEKLRNWVDQNRDQAIVVTHEHLQRHFKGIEHPVHVLHSDPVKWPMASKVDKPDRIHIGLPEVLKELGVKNKVPISNVPVGKGVLQPKGKSGLIDPEKFNVTVSGGGLGAEVAPLTKQVLKSDLPEDAVVHAVAGKNKGALKELRSIAKKDPRLQVHGFAPLPTMMREADLNVVRTHGTTFAETVASGKPAVYYGPKAPLVGKLHPVTDFQADLTRRTALYAGEQVGHPVAIGLENVPDAVEEAVENAPKFRRLAVEAKKQMGNPADQAVKQIMKPRSGYLRPKE